jgi:hypothetical protein
MVPLVVLLGGAQADEKPAAPKYVRPSSGRAAVEGENLKCAQTRSRLEPYIRRKTVKKDGKLVTMDEILYRKVFYTEWRTLSMKEVRAYVTTGQAADPTKLLKPLDIAKLKEQLAKDTRVFFLPDAGKMDPAFAKELKAGNVVLVLPPPKPAPRPVLPAEKK